MNGHLYRYPLTLVDAVISRALWGMVLLAVLGGSVGACSPPDSTQALSERVERYWELKQAKRWDEIYDQYLDPMVKNDLSQDAFIGKRRLAFDIVSYTVPEVREVGDEVTVTVTNEANIPVPAGQQKRRMIRRTVSTADDWVRRDGVWYVALLQ